MHGGEPSGGRPDGRLVTRDALTVDVPIAAPQLLGSRIVSDGPDGRVVVRVVEVEGYRGADDPASHGYRGRTPRTEVMFGPPGHLYVYFVYGMHFCVNVTCLPDGVCGAILLRAGEVVEGIDVARRRRPSARRDRDLARGPARLASALALDRSQGGVDLTDPASPVRLEVGEPAVEVASGPRVGVSAGADTPWRWWVPGHPAVSPYRPGRRRRPGADDAVNSSRRTDGGRP